MSDEIETLKAEEKTAQVEWESFDEIGNPDDWKVDEASATLESNQPHPLASNTQIPCVMMMIALFFAITSGYISFWPAFFVFMIFGPMISDCWGRGRC